MTLRLTLKSYTSSIRQISNKQKFTLLNSSYEVLQKCSWKKAVKLLYKGKASLFSEDTLILNYFIKPNFLRKEKLVPSKKDIIRRDKSICRYCGIHCINPTIDHVIPKSKGGLNSWENLVTACLKCNNSKGDKLLGP